MLWEPNKYPPSTTPPPSTHWGSYRPRLCRIGVRWWTVSVGRENVHTNSLYQYCYQFCGRIRLNEVLQPALQGVLEYVHHSCWIERNTTGYCFPQFNAEIPAHQHVSDNADTIIREILKEFA